MYESWLLSHPQLTTSRSEETTAYRCNEGGARHRKRVSRRLSSPEVVLRRHQRTHQTLRRAIPSDKISTITDGYTQELKGVKEKLEDLVPWLTALDECLKKANSDPQEAERREKLKRSVLHIGYLSHSSQSSTGP